MLRSESLEVSKDVLSTLRLVCSTQKYFADLWRALSFRDICRPSEGCTILRGHSLWASVPLHYIVAVMALSGCMSAMKTECCQANWSQSNCMCFEQLARPPCQDSGSQSTCFALQEEQKSTGNWPWQSVAFFAYPDFPGLLCMGMRSKNLLWGFRVHAADVCALQIVTGSFPSWEKIFGCCCNMC